MLYGDNRYQLKIKKIKIGLLFSYTLSFLCAREREREREEKGAVGCNGEETALGTLHTEAAGTCSTTPKSPLHL